MTSEFTNNPTAEGLVLLESNPGYSSLALLRQEVLIGVWLQAHEQALVRFSDALVRLARTRQDGTCLLHVHAETRPPGEEARAALMRAMHETNGKLRSFELAYEGGGFASAANRAVAITLRTLTGFPIGFGSDIEASILAVAKTTGFPVPLLRASLSEVTRQAQG